MTLLKKRRRELAWMLGGAAAITLAGCGGGGGPSAPQIAAATGTPDLVPAAALPPSVGQGTPANASTSADAALASTGGIMTADISATGTALAALGMADPGASIAGEALVAPLQVSSDTTVATASPAPAPVVSAVASPSPSPVLGDCDMFPSSAIFNTRIDDTSKFPASPNSGAWVNLVGGGVSMLANWGTTSNASDLGGYFGMPVNVVDGTSGTTQWPTVSFNFAASGLSSDTGYPDKSDCAADSSGNIVHGCSSLGDGQGRFPFPSGTVMAEGGTCTMGSCGDHHVLVLDKGSCKLWEAFYAFPLNGQWYAASTAAWDLRSLALRPDGWASADAAGLPITPLLAKASEASSGEIRHALRVTFRDAALSLQHQWPARFAAGGDNPGAIPFGSLLRLRADFQIPDNWTAQAKAVALAAKRYGMYVADNGMDFYVQGEPNSAWDPTTSSQLRAITMSQMEFVDLKAVTSDPRFSPDSMAASW